MAMAVIIVVALLIAILASAAVVEGLGKNSVCQSCGRHLDQTTTCKDHGQVCCACHGHELWS